MDLFYTGEFEHDAQLISKELKAYRKSLGLKSKSRMYILYGDSSYVGDNMLVVDNPHTGNYMNTENYKALRRLLTGRGMHQFFVTNCYILPKKPSLTEVKSFSTWIHRIARLIEPRLIVTMGEVANLSFMKRKPIMRDSHGSQVGEFDGAPIYTTYDMGYYTKQSPHEDLHYKLFIQEQDWNNIQAEYDERV